MGRNETFLKESILNTSTKMTLGKYRKKIDQIDEQLLGLLARRMKVSKEIAKYKKKHKLPIQDKKREAEVIEDRIKKGKRLGLHDKKFLAELFRLIMKKSRKLQR